MDQIETSRPVRATKEVAMCGTGLPQVKEVVSIERKIFNARRVRMIVGMLAVGAATFVSGGIFFSEGPALARSALMQSSAAPVPALPNSSPGTQPFSFADLVERVSPAVVSVHVDVEPALPPSPYRNFRAPRTFRSQAAGSGFIVDASGY